MARVIVVGAGVVGLSCAVRLLERGHRVDVVARDLPLETTSAVAAALWYPYLAHPADRVAEWGAATYAELSRLAGDEQTGVVVRRGTEVARAALARPSWADRVAGFDAPRALPAGYRSGWSFDAPVAEMPRYLRWLQDRVEELGGTVTRLALAGLPDRGEVVVVAAGLGGRLLGSDRTVTPVRGQVVRVGQVGLDEWWLDGSQDPGDDGGAGGGPTYVVPRGEDIVVGGTAEPGQWDREPDPRTAERILERACALVPALADARVLGHRVGLRPARPAVRVEVVTSAGGGRVVHCYGHGGAGVTLSWGCADEVAELVGG